MAKHKQPQGIKLHEILAQCADPKATVHWMPERAAWFRKMLNNAIANERDAIAFLVRNPRLLEEEPTRDQVHYKCIARCETALNQLQGA